MASFGLVVAEGVELTPHRTDDAFLIRFLRARRFDVEKAHRLVRELFALHLTCSFISILHICIVIHEQEYVGTSLVNLWA
jgi:hypothetical protein